LEEEQLKPSTFAHFYRLDGRTEKPYTNYLQEIESMNKQTEKIRLIYVPFLIIAITLIGSYTFLNWQLMIKMQLFPIKEVIINSIVPFILPWLPVLIFLRPRIKLLNLDTTKNRDLYIVYQFIAVLAIGIPTIITQDYLYTATGKLTELDNISEISKHKETKYYRLKRYYIDKKNIGIYNESLVSGKSNQDLYISSYRVCPILEDTTSNKELNNGQKPLLVINGKPCPGMDISEIPKEKIISVTKLAVFTAFEQYGELAKNGAIVITAKEFVTNTNTNTTVENIDSILRTPVKAWLGIEYKEKINNRLSEVDKERLIKVFFENSQRDFQTQNQSKFIYLKRLGYSDELDCYKDAIRRTYRLNSSETVLISVNESFESRNGNKLAWILSSFAIGGILFLLMILGAKLKCTGNEEEMTSL